MFIKSNTKPYTAVKADSCKRISISGIPDGTAILYADSLKIGSYRSHGEAVQALRAIAGELGREMPIYLNKAGDTVSILTEMDRIMAKETGQPDGFSVMMFSSDGMRTVLDTLETETKAEEAIGLILSQFSHASMPEAAPAPQAAAATESNGIDWFQEFMDRLRDYSEGSIWTNGLELLCRTGSAAEALADLLETLYRSQGQDVKGITGYYDPEEDRKNNEEDRHTGWHYCSIG